MPRWAPQHLHRDIPACLGGVVSQHVTDAGSRHWLTGIKEAMELWRALTREPGVAAATAWHSARQGADPEGTIMRLPGGGAAGGPGGAVQDDPADGVA